ncbi:MAG: hypothetical protein M3211_12870, partial [Actinomycetota bacterium]|nr:hypothetical protein [Actinomycetota bacterium]
MLVLVMALLFALLFGHALVAYTHRRDPMAGEVSLLFGAVTGIFVTAVTRQLLGGEPPAWLSAVSSILVLVLPVLTLRLVSRFRSLPPWLLPSAVLLYLAVTIPVVVYGSDVPGWLAAIAVAVFVVTETVAAGYFVVEGRERAGAAKLRLYV